LLHRLYSEGPGLEVPYPAIGGETHKHSVKKLLSPQSLEQCAHSVMSAHGPTSILLGENLQAKFEAVSQKLDEEIHYNMDFRTSQLMQELGLNIDQPLQVS